MTLFENFNTSNQTSPHFEKHENFVIDLKDPGCFVVQTMQRHERCLYVAQNEKCQENVNIFDYTYFFYCIMDSPNYFVDAFGVFLLLLVVAAMYIFIGTATDLFFCPPLKIITKKLGLSENFAGVTLLAIGNSVPDLVSNLVGVTDDIGTTYSDLMSSAMFITSFIGGLIIFLRPMKVEPTTFTRDISFLMLAVCYIDYSVKSDATVSLSEAIIIIVIYFAYFSIIIMDQFILVRTLKNLQKQIKQQDFTTPPQAARLEKLEEEVGIEIVFKPRPGLKIYYAETAAERDNTSNQQMLQQFFTSLRPFDKDDWDDGGWFDRLCLILCTPINITLLLLAPCVDFNLERHGWSKLLNCLQVMIMPYVILRVTMFEYEIHDYKICDWSLVVTAPTALLVFCITRTDRQPQFHILFALFSMAGSIFMIRTFTEEISNSCEVIGMITFRTQSFLGATVEAWGDQAGDLAAAIAISRQGYQKMALAAAIAGPLFCLCVALGGVFVFMTLQSKNHVFEVPKGSMGENCTAFLMIICTMILFSVASTNFYCRRSLGVYVLSTYALFLFYCTLGEFELIHPFGTDHSEDYGLYYI